jgi:UDP-N-acetylmuramate dehydrogenase
LPEAGATMVRAGGAALLPVVARRTAAAGLTGFEWAVGVPGSIGGAVRMNAGGHGSDMAASLVAVGAFDLARGRLERLDVDQLHLGYRCSAIEPEQIVVWADLGLEVGDADRAKAEISDIVLWRREHQPGGQNAGSVFANPEGDSAGRLIDSLGLKGLRIGSAAVSTKHANFIQADPNGSADDVAALIRELQLRVAAATGFELEPENRLVGFDL